MTTNFGKTPRDNLGNFINLKELNDIRMTGFYEMVISSATIKNGISSKGTAWQAINLGLAVMNHGQPAGRIYDTEFISSTSQRLQDICFFANLRDAEGNVICPDATTVEYMDKTTGETKTFQEISELKNARIYGVVEYTGEKTLNNGNSYPQYNLHICNELGQTASEVAHNQPVTALKPMLERLGIQTNANVRTQQNVQTMATQQAQNPNNAMAAQPQQMGPIATALAQQQSYGQQNLQQRSQMNQFQQSNIAPAETYNDDLPF